MCGALIDRVHYVVEHQRMSVTFRLDESSGLTRTDHEVLGRRNEEVEALTRKAVAGLDANAVVLTEWTVDLHDEPVLPRSPTTFFLAETADMLPLLYPYPLGAAAPGPLLNEHLSWRGSCSDRVRVKLYNICSLDPRFDVDFGDPRDTPLSACIASVQGTDPEPAMPLIAGRYARCGCVLFYQERPYVDYAASVLDPVVIQRDLSDLKYRFESLTEEDKETHKIRFVKNVNAHLTAEALCDRIRSLISVRA